MTDFTVHRALRGDFPAVSRVLDQCEVHCVSLCCGPNAFDFEPGFLRQHVLPADRAGAQRALDELPRVLAVVDGAPPRFFFYDAEHDRSEVRAFFEDLQRGLHEALESG